MRFEPGFSRAGTRGKQLSSSTAIGFFVKDICPKSFTQMGGDVRRCCYLL